MIKQPDRDANLINEPVVILLEDETPWSWNPLYAGKVPWKDRKNEAQRVHDLVACHLIGCDQFTVPVHIVVEAGFSGKRRRDPDDIMDKFYIDGLKGRLIEDDDMDHVKSVTVIASRASEDYVQIIVSPWRV